MNSDALSIHPDKVTEVFLILHERAHRPPELEYEYMTGQLRQQLEEKAFGQELTRVGARRARKIGKHLHELNLACIVTENFSTPRVTARFIAKAAGDEKPIPIILDDRICESDLSYLTRERFQQLGQAEKTGDPNATVRDWMEHCPKNFADLVSKHITVWNEILDNHTGQRFAYVLHVEGMLLYPALLLGLPPEKMACLHISRTHPIHVRLYSNRSPLLSLGDEEYWKNQPLTIFGQYG